MWSILDVYKYISDEEGISIRELEKRLGASSGAISKALRNNTDMQSKWLYSLVENFPQYNAKWILTGEGDIKNTSTMVAEPSNTYKFKTDKDLPSQDIPLFDIHAAAGLAEVFNSEQSVPIDHIRIPNAPKCDGAIFATGDSMYPLIKSGDLVMFKQVPNEMSSIFFGNMYVVSIDMNGDELITIKWIQKSELGNEYIKLVSENRHHEPKDIRLDQVTAMAIIKIHTRFYTMS